MASATNLYRRLPPGLRARLRLQALRDGVRLSADPFSALRYWRAAGERRAGGAAVPVRLRPLGGRPVRLRPATSDARVVRETFVGRYHLPPTELPEPRTIADLGANVGLTAAHFAALYPQARILAAELDAGNAELAARNTEPWRDRCEVVRAAVWWESGTVAYSAEPGEEYGMAVTAGGDAGGDRTAPARTVGELLGRLPDGPVDYVKMDIEGAEALVLTRATDWADRVRSIKVEVHGDFPPDACARALGALGFQTRPDSGHPLAVVGVRSQE